MIDAAKIADLALLLIDGSYGFEMVCYQTFIFTRCSVRFSSQLLRRIYNTPFSL
jgi:hypothetical protein